LEEKVVVKFSSEGLNVVEQDLDCMIVDLDLMHEGLNLNNCYISHEAMLKSQKTIYNKPIIYNLNNEYDPLNSSDVTDHAEGDDTTMLESGIIPESADINFKEKNGKVFVNAKGIIHKIYNPTLVNILRERGGNVKISAEMKVVDGYVTEEGVLVINEFVFLGVCLLGIGILEGMKGSELNVTKFSKKEYNDKYICFVKKQKANVEKTDEDNKKEPKVDNKTKNIDKDNIKNKKKKESTLMDEEKKVTTEKPVGKDPKDGVSTVDKGVDEAKSKPLAKPQADNVGTEKPKEDTEKKTPEKVVEKKEDDGLAKKFEVLEKENIKLKNALQKFEHEKDVEEMKASLVKCQAIFSEDEYNTLFSSIEGSTKEDFKAKLGEAAIKYAEKAKEVGSKDEKEEDTNVSYSVGFKVPDFEAPKLNGKNGFESLEDVFNKYSV